MNHLVNDLEREKRDHEAPSPGRHPPQGMPHHPPPSDEPINHMAMRQNARSLLGDLIQRHRDRSHQLEALSKSMPLELSPAADEALWTILTYYRNV